MLAVWENGAEPPGTGEELALKPSQAGANQLPPWDNLQSQTHLQPHTYFFLLGMGWIMSTQTR